MRTCPNCQAVIGMESHDDFCGVCGFDFARDGGFYEFDAGDWHDLDLDADDPDLADPGDLDGDPETAFASVYGDNY